MRVEVVVHLGLPVHLNDDRDEFHLERSVPLKVDQFPQDEVALLVLEHFKQGALL